MTSSIAEPDIDVRAAHVVVTDHHVTVEFTDGRTISVPLTWYPRILHGTPAERTNFEIWDDGLYWPDLNGDISFSAMLLGKKSGESVKSFQRWLERRARGEKEQIPTQPLPPKFARQLRRSKSAHKEVKKRSGARSRAGQKGRSA